jgi:hypothetical protein
MFEFRRRQCGGRLNKYLLDYDSFLRLVVMRPALSLSSPFRAYRMFRHIWN